MINFQFRNEFVQCLNKFKIDKILNYRRFFDFAFDFENFFDEQLILNIFEIIDNVAKLNDVLTENTNNDTLLRRNMKKLIYWKFSIAIKRIICFKFDLLIVFDFTIAKNVFVFLIIRFVCARRGASFFRSRKNWFDIFYQISLTIFLSIAFIVLSFDRKKANNTFNNDNRTL